MGKNFRICVAALFCFCAGAGEAGLLVGGSSHICEIVGELAGEGVYSVVTLVPPTMCPGHFDVKPSEIEAIGRARGVLLHDWQASMPVIKSALAAAEVPPERVHVLGVAGNWLVPGVQAEAVKRVAEVLAQLEPGRAVQIEAQAAARVKGVEEAGAAAAEKLKGSGSAGVVVICHEKLTGFLQWCGFAVVGEYGEDGVLSAGRMRVLVQDGRAAGVRLVVDNLQGGGLRTGAALARDTGAAHVIVSNFPGGFSGVESWEETLQRNVEILTRAVGR